MSKKLQRTCNIEIERNSIETVPCQRGTCVFSVEDLLSLASGQLPEKPLQTVCPVYQIKMADSNKRAFVIPPLA